MKIFSYLVRTSNVPLQISKRTSRTTCTPDWEPLFQKNDKSVVFFY